MRIFIFTLVAIFNIVFQTSFLYNFEVFNILPNTSFVLVVIYGLLRGSSSGATFGFFIGLLQDIVVGYTLGVYAGIYMLVGALIGKFSEDFYQTNPIPASIYTFGLTFIYQSIYYFLFFFLTGKTDIFYYFGQIIFLEAFYNAFAMLVMFFPIVYINNKFTKKEVSRRNIF